MKSNLKNRFFHADWVKANKVKSPFVRYPGKQESAADMLRLKLSPQKPELSVVIPTMDANRNGYFFRLLDQIDSQSYKNSELIVIRGDSRQGRAINIGAATARGEYLLTLDDDTMLPDPKTFEKLINVMEAHPEIGIAGGNNVICDDVSPFIKRTMKEIPRRSWEAVNTITDSDLAEHPCLIMRKKDFIEIGGENELLPRGLDPYLRMRFREFGKRVVVVPGVIYHHLPPSSLQRLIRQFFRNGKQAAFVNKYFPQWVFETPNDHGSFKSRVPFSIRIFRFPMRLLEAIIKNKPIFFMSELAYGCGFLYGLLSSSRNP